MWTSEPGILAREDGEPSDDPEGGRHLRGRLEHVRPPAGLVTVPAPTKGLRYEKGKAKEPFQTWEQIERRIARGGSPDVWDCLFLSTGQVVEVLEHVKGIR